jgi:DNA-binding response OmpR family regulator
MEKKRREDDGGPKRILVVDDHRDTADLLADALTMTGYEARAAYDGMAALDLARSFKPHVAMLDIGMPVMDGYELARRLRGQAETATAHLIAFTGYTEQLQRRHTEAGTKSGFAEYLVKPVDLAQVVGAIRRVLSEDE